MNMSKKKQLMSCHVYIWSLWIWSEVKDTENDLFDSFLESVRNLLWVFIAEKI